MWNHGAPLEQDGAAKTAAPDQVTGTR